MSGYREITKLENSRNCLRRIARHDEPQFSKDSIVNVMERFVKTVKVMDDTILVPCLLMDRQVGDSTDIIPAPGKNSTSNQHTLEHAGAHGKRSAAHSKNVHEFLNSSELFNLYNMLKALKTDLLWTGKDDSEDDEDSTCDEQRSAEVDNLLYARCDSNNKSDAVSVTSSSPSTEAVGAASRSVTNTNTNTLAPTATATATTTNSSAKGHNRCPSTASVASILSTTSVCNLSDSESEISNENDSGMESEGHKSDNQRCGTESVSGSDDTDSRNAAVASSTANTDKATELAKRCRRHLNGLYQCLEQMTEAAHYLTVRYQSDIGPV